MEITFNNRKHEIEEQTSVQKALNLWLGDKQQGIAVAVNDTIVPRSQWEDRVLQAGDNILVIKATQGG
jgi:sulfur carrier protein